MHVVVALLSVHADQRDAFRTFESIAARVMARHGLVLERAVASDDGTRELHVIRVPSDAAFDAYRADPELAEARPLRERAVAATEIWRGHDVRYLPPYF